MSLLVHELLIGTGGGGSNASSLQAPPSNPVPIASVTVTHSNSAVQVAHIQQSRVVTITSSQSRLTPEKSSRLADALAGNPPYSYANSQQRFSRSHTSNRNFVSHIVSGPGISSIQTDNLKPIKPSSSRQTYILPFVLQDHNYGAPPPPTPPHSPPPPPPPLSVSSPLPYGYKVHQIFTPTTTTTTTNTRVNSNHIVSPTKIQNQYAKILSEQPMLTINNAGTVQISNSNSNGSVVESPLPSTHSMASQIMATMPLHRQQFMPQPKPLVYSAPHIPVVASVCETLTSQSTVTVPCNGGQDTDEESRLSDRSSSVGPSGEETETAPEGEGEEHIQADDSITRCICNFTHDDGYMIQCDRCFVWQHVDCMEIDRGNIPDEYLCEACKPRVTDKSKARALQIRRRQEIRAHLARVSSSDSEDNMAPTLRNKNSSSGKSQDRKVLKKKKPKTSKENKNSRKHSSSSNSKSSILSASSNNVKSDHSADDRDTKPSLIKSRRRQSTLSGSSHSGGDDGTINSTFSLEQLRSWIEDYEVAVTNHYSPELRAKAHAARINGISAEFRESTQGAMLGHRCRVAPSYDAGPDSFEDKILVAATRLQVGTAIIEYQGKYTLKAQWNTIQIPPGLPYLPFVLQYNMQKEGLHVCIDARTYGNDARFARRSSQYNAEIRHVVERGSVHLYVVACKEIDEEEEITLPLETAICQQSVPTKSSNAQSNLIKTEGNEALKEAVKLSVNPSQIRKNGILQNNKKNVRKPLLSLSLPQPMSRISRRTASSESFSCDDPISSPPQITSPVKQRRASGCAGNRSPAKCILKSPSKSPSKTPIDDSSSGESPHHESPGGGDKLDGHKMTREERKIAAYMKAFERMEKAAQRRQEMEKKKVEDRGKRHNHLHDDDDEDGSRNYDEGSKYDKEGKKRRANKGSSNKILNTELSEEENYTSSSEGERSKPNEGILKTYGSPPSSGVNTIGFRFPKTKKALMNEWLNETVDPVLHSSSLGCEVATGVPTCYMRSPSTPARRGGSTVPSASITTGDAEMAGRSAKKRWLRQAIIDETEPHNAGFSICSSPNSRPDSPIGGGDYITPLKKRRLARESMSSEQSNTPPSTPLHTGLDDKYNEEMELDHASDENFDVDESKVDMKAEEKTSLCEQVKKEEEKPNIDEDSKSYDSDHLTIDISKIDKDIKLEIKESILQDTKMSVSSTICTADLENKVLNLKIESIKVEKKSNSMDEDERCSSNTVNSCEDKVIEPIKKKVNKKDEQKRSKKVAKSPKVRKKSRIIVKYKNYDKNRNMQRKKKIIKGSSKTKKKETKKLSEKEKAKSKKTEKLSNEKVIKICQEKNSITTTDICSNIQESIEHKEENNFEDKKIKTLTDSKVPEVMHDHFKILKKFPDQKLLDEMHDSAISKEGQSSNMPDNDKHDKNLINAHDSNLPEDNPDLKIPREEHKEESIEEKDDHDISEEKDYLKIYIEEKCDSKALEETSLNLSEVTHGPRTPEEYVKTDSNSNYFNSSDSKKISFVEEDKNSHILEDLKDSNISNFIHLSTDDDLSESLHDKSIEKEDVLKYEEEGFHEPPNITSTKPAPVKRKLSILEYRKRKSISCEVDTKEELCLKGMSSQSFSFEASQSIEVPISSTHFLDNAKIGSQEEARVAAEEFHSKPMSLFTNIVQSPSKLDKLKCESGDSEDVKWNAAPTLLEQQRENLTARLRREFGLCLPEDSQFKLKLGLGDFANKEKWAELEKKYQFSGKKFSPNPTLNFAANASASTCDTTKAVGALAATSSSVSPKGMNLNELHSCHMPPAVPLPPTFEKLNDVLLPPECAPKALAEPSGEPRSLSTDKLEKSKPFVQCKSDSKNSTTS